MFEINVLKATRTGAARVLAFGLLAAVTTLLVGLMLAPMPAHAITLTVNSTADPGTDGCNSTECTLREAINVSNGLSTTETINFNIPDGPAPGLEVKTISPSSSLPLITENVTIDGYTQPGAVVNTATTNANSAVLKIELNGAGTDANTSGLVATGEDAGGTRIKGLVINRFGNHGVFINAPNTVVEGNFIGTNAAGNADLGNSGAGVVLQSSSGSLVGGQANAAQNIISGNGATGVTVAGTSATGNVISNNHIGTDADAGEDLGNSLSGVTVNGAPDVVIGGNGANGAGKDVGDAKGEGNIISGNGQHGVSISGINASGTRVQGNFIGLNRNGNGFSDIGNARDGVHVSSTPQVEIGGTGSTFSNGQGNTISDNGEHGVEIAGQSSTSNKVLGNRIGTDFNGGSDFGNAQDGVRIGNAGNNTIGGTVAGARNVISGNDANGVFISGTSSATFNRVEGNFIGTDALGGASLGRNLGNAEVGVRVETPGNFIGGTATGARNVISGNAGVGVSMLGTGAGDNTVQGNFIGPDVNGAQTLGGNFHGVFISDASGNTVGGTVGASTNTISGNEHHGVMVIGADATGNSILRNSIFENGKLGIELDNDGVTLNDARDPDTGPNNLQNFPAIDSATTSGDTTTLRGRLNSNPNRTFVIRFFSNPTPNFPTGFGEGKKLIGQKSVTTDSTGRVAFTKVVQAVPAGNNVTATATDPDGNTSELSRALILN
jgi:CSLREA domain-containing protein